MATAVKSQKSVKEKLGQDEIDNIIKTLSERHANRESAAAAPGHTLRITHKTSAYLFYRMFDGGKEGRAIGICNPAYWNTQKYECFRNDRDFFMNMRMDGNAFWYRQFSFKFSYELLNNGHSKRKCVGCVENTFHFVMARPDQIFHYTQIPGGEPLRHQMIRANAPYVVLINGKEPYVVKPDCRVLSKSALSMISMDELHEMATEKSRANIRWISTGKTAINL